MEISLHKSKTHLLPLLFITKIFLFLTINASATSITFNYEQFRDVDHQNLNLQGEVFQENGMLNLTRYKKDSAGRVTYNNSLQLWDNETRTLANFTTRFTFIINVLNESRDGKGDGITFFLAEPGFPFPSPPDGTGIGLVSRAQMQDQNYLDEHPFVAVEFDTFSNTDVGDPPYDHVGILVKTMQTNYRTQWYTMNDGRKYDAEITYDSSSFQLSVMFTGYKDNVKIRQNYSHQIDLRDYLPEEVQFGISSATGLRFELHTLCSWSFNSSLEMPGVVQRSKSNNKRLVIGVSIGSVVVIVGLCIALFLVWRSNCRVKRRDRLDLSLDKDFECVGPKKFSYNELVRATNNFAEEHKLGEGGFGGVYKGFIRDLNSYVAVKKVSHESRQGVKEYASEVKIISQLRHKNLVQLIGWCHEKNDFLLIYEFMPNGSLDYHLYRSRNLLTWPARYNIAKGLASAVLYLHEEWERCVVHRDIKSSNIMLDSNFDTKLGDFGLARLVEHGKGSETTIVAGTKGYMAPECATISKAIRESDIYSFGIVALEIACGRKPIDHYAPNDQVMMVEWVWELYGKGELLEAADKRFDGDFDEQELERLMILGLSCAHPDYTMRPTIRQALQVLNFEASLPTLPPTMPKATYVAPCFSDIGSSIYSSAYASSSATNDPRPSTNSRSYTRSSQYSSNSGHSSTKGQF
ncbi:L-type lectin-domain containing receptor kinase IX.1-like [Neltuma alba]|uniref:L-type lectin-domain containing receptor kinase IX.1-like n=1 Tax=Neltuma alba TaxID=207710 RepID=UPI0010A56526|nr:L-type lectin-domain containing receptor kinase IX.1-like [Prosopis alba]